MKWPSMVEIGNHNFHLIFYPKKKKKIPSNFNLDGNAYIDTTLKLGCDQSNKFIV